MPKALHCPFYHHESYYERADQRKGLLTLQNSSAFALWKPLDEAFNNTKSDMTGLTKLLHLDKVQDITVASLVNRLNKLKEPREGKSKSFWDSVGLYVIIKLVILCALLSSSVIIRERRKAKSCEATVKIWRTRTTTPKPDEEDVANVDVHTACAESTRGQPTEVLRKTVETMSHQMPPLVLDLANVPPRA